MARFCFEKPDAVFIRVPQIEDICIEFGIEKTDAKTITCMYELFKRITSKEEAEWDNKTYDEGYRTGYNDGIEDAVSKIDGVSWEVEKLKK